MYQSKDLEEMEVMSLDRLKDLRNKIEDYIKRSILTEQNLSNYSIMTNKQLLQIFTIAEKYIDPTVTNQGDEENINIFELLDDELARRVSLDVDHGGEASLDPSEVSEVLKKVMMHNAACPSGYEIGLEMFVTESSELMQKNLALLSKAEYFNAACGYAASGYMHELPDLV